MIRPSLLPLASKCGYAVTLAEQYPQGSTASEDGKAWHTAATLPDFQLPLPVAQLEDWKERQHEVPLKLVDLDGGGVITQGTADLVLFGEDSVTVIDWKTGDPARVPRSSDNLQILAYGLAAAREYGKARFRVGCYFTQGEFLDVTPWLEGSDFAVVESRIRAAARMDPSVPVVGSHCDTMCYRRSYCRAFILPATQEPSQMLAVLSTPGDLTLGQAQAALRLKGALKSVAEVLDARLRDYARQVGGIEEDGKIWGPITTKGKRTISLEDVEKNAAVYADLDRAGFIRQGAPYETFRWTRKKGM